MPCTKRFLIIGLVVIFAKSQLSAACRNSVRYCEPVSPASWFLHWNLYLSYIVFCLGLQCSSNFFSTSANLSSLSPSPYWNVSNTLTASPPMTDKSVHTRFFSAASLIPVATSNLVHVFLQDFDRLDADLSLIFKGLGGGMFDVAICNFFIVSATMSVSANLCSYKFDNTSWHHATFFASSVQ